MTICGEKRDKFNNKHGTPYDTLQSTTMGAVLRLMERCHRKKRNYILDQEMWYPSKYFTLYQGQETDVYNGHFCSRKLHFGQEKGRIP